MFLDPNSSKPRIIAHRGARVTRDGFAVLENTLPAFQAALDAGAEIIETDIQVTKDGVPVIFRDADLKRTAGLAKKLDQLSWLELQQVPLPHQSKLSTLAEALEVFADAKFNIDFKSTSVISPAAEVIRLHNAQNRVLLASFSNTRLARATKELGQAVHSCSAITVQLFYWAFLLKSQPLARKLLGKTVALQIPLHFRSARFDTEQFIQFVHGCEIEVHYWVVNEPSEMIRLAQLGADGIITDFPELAHSILKKS